MKDKREFHIASRSELLPYLLGLPIGLSRKQAKDLLKFQAWRVRGMTPSGTILCWSRATL